MECSEDMGDRVLIVDDHASFRTVARMVLSTAGYEVVGEAIDGEHAISAAIEHEPDLVLLDVGLPGADGFDVAALLSRVPRPPRVVIVSSRAAGELGDRLVRSALPFIPKERLSAEALAAALV